jgi:hypothetical protein
MVIEVSDFEESIVVCELWSDLSLIDESLSVLFCDVLVVSIYVLQCTFSMLQYQRQDSSKCLLR